MEPKYFTILVAEDNSDDLKLLKRKINSINRNVKLIITNDGEDALNYIYHRGKYKDKEKFPKPDLIILDIRMPKINGIEVLETIKSDKENEELKKIPVIMLTISTLERDISESFKAGCDDYLVKSGTFEDFEKIINPIEEYFQNKKESNLNAA